jgi:hypothetical protein
MPPKKAPTVAQLKADAKAAGLTGYSKLDKAGLIDLLKGSSGSKVIPKVKKIGGPTSKATAVPKVKKIGGPTSKVAPKAKATSKAAPKAKATSKPKVAPKAKETPKIARTSPKASPEGPKWQYDSTELADALCTGKRVPNAWLDVSKGLSKAIEKEYQKGGFTASGVKVKHYRVFLSGDPSIKGKMKLPDGNYVFTARLKRVA